MCMWTCVCVCMCPTSWTLHLPHSLHSDQGCESHSPPLQRGEALSTSLSLLSCNGVMITIQPNTLIHWSGFFKLGPWAVKCGSV